MMVALNTTGSLRWTTIGTLVIKVMYYNIYNTLGHSLLAMSLIYIYSGATYKICLLINYKLIIMITEWDEM